MGLRILIRAIAGIKKGRVIMRWLGLYCLLINVLIFFWYSVQYSVVTKKEKGIEVGEQVLVPLILLTELPAKQVEALKQK